jgi:hypothetical protein
VQPCDCVTVNGWPATIAVPVRDRPDVEAAVTVTEAGPLPEAGDRDSHGTLLTAVHGQAAVVVIATRALLPDGAAASELGAIA